LIFSLGEWNKAAYVSIKARLGMSVQEHPFFPEWLSLEVKSGAQTCITGVYLHCTSEKKTCLIKVG